MSRGARLAALLDGGSPFSPLSLNPIAWWPLTDGSGTTPQDISGNGHHGEFVSNGDGPAWFGDPVTALDLNGTDSDGVVMTGDLLDEPAALTICGWVNLDNAGGDLLNISNSVILRFINSLSVVWTHAGGGGFTVVGTGATGPTGLHHFAGVIDPGNSRQEVYQDGVSVASGSSSAAIVYNAGNTYIGRNPDGTVPNDGLHRHVIVFPFGLSTAQIVQVMNATAFP
jgi:hypothetical protein